VTYLHHVQKITEISKPTTQRWEFIYTTASTNSNHQQMCSAQKSSDWWHFSVMYIQISAVSVTDIVAWPH